MNEEKFLLILKPCQSGKTKLMIENIKRLIDITNVQKNINDISIIFCDNSLLQTDQLKERIIKENIEAIIISSTSNIKDHNALFVQIISENKKVIICCANNTQITNINELINLIEKSHDQFIKNYNFHIYIDEVDKTFSGKRFNQIINWQNNEKIKKLTLITASPENTLEHFNKFYPNKKIPILPLEFSYDREIYHKIDDSNLIYISETNFNLDYILEKYNFNNNTFLFCPAQVKKITHYEYSEILNKYGFNVLVVNSNGCNLFYEDKDIFKIELKEEDKLIDEKKTEMSNWLFKIYNDEYYGLKNKKFAITGNLSIGRGITISSPNLMLTDAIIPSDFNNWSNGYQLIGRMCGNMKKWENYKKINIYGTYNSIDKLIEYQNKVINLVENAYKYDIDKIDIDDYKLQNDNEKYGIPIKIEFQMIDIFNKFIKKIYIYKNGQKLNDTSRIKIINKLKELVEKKLCIIINKNNYSFDLNNYVIKNLKIIGYHDEPWDKVRKNPLTKINTFIEHNLRLKAEETNVEKPGECIFYVLCNNYPPFERKGVKKGTIFVTFSKTEPNKAKN
jgi:hypothetical protein